MQPEVDIEALTTVLCHELSQLWHTLPPTLLLRLPGPGPHAVQQVDSGAHTLRATPACARARHCYDIQWLRHRGRASCLVGGRAWSGSAAYSLHSFTVETFCSQSVLPVRAACTDAVPHAADIVVLSCRPPMPGVVVAPGRLYDRICKSAYLVAACSRSGMPSTYSVSRVARRATWCQDRFPSLYPAPDTTRFLTG